MILSHHSRDYLLTPPPLGVALSHHADGSRTIMGAKPEGSLGTRCIEINIAQGYRVGTGTRDGEKTMMKYVYRVFEREGWLCLDRMEGPREHKCPSSRKACVPSFPSLSKAFLVTEAAPVATSCMQVAAKLSFFISHQVAGREGLANRASSESVARGRLLHIRTFRVALPRLRSDRGWGALCWSTGRVPIDQAASHSPSL